MDIELILDTLSAHGLVRLNKRTGNWYQIYCPFHSNGQERKPSCGVSLVSQVRAGSSYPEGMFHCFACSASYNLEDGITKILQIKGFQETGVEWLSKNIPGYEPESESDALVPDILMEQLSNKFMINKISNSVDKKFISESELASYRFIVPYMYERKLTDEIIERYDVGYDANWIPPGRSKKVPCITFPVRDADGNTLFLCRRSIQGKLYNYPEGVVKPVFGIDMIPKGTKSVIICESIINALTAEVYGYDAVALMGTGNSYQIQQLKTLGVSEYVLALDGDDAGRRGAAKLKRALKDSAIIWTIHMPDGMDLNDCDKSTFDKLYQERE